MDLQNKTNASTSDSLEEQLLKARNTTIDEFESVEHRLEFVDEIDGIEYINDSKATDVDSTAYSLDFMKVPVVWIAGASETETDYALFTDLVKEKVKAIVCLGKGKALMDIYDEVESFEETETISEAVMIATSLANAGDIILFSPACSGNDKFRNYKERGLQFRKVVEELNDW